MLWTGGALRAGHGDHSPQVQIALADLAVNVLGICVHPILILGACHHQESKMHQRCIFQKSCCVSCGEHALIMISAVHCWPHLLGRLPKQLPIKKQQKSTWTAEDGPAFPDILQRRMVWMASPRPVSMRRLHSCRRRLSSPAASWMALGGVSALEIGSKKDKSVLSPEHTRASFIILLEHRQTSAKCIISMQYCYKSIRFSMFW